MWYHFSKTLTERFRLAFLLQLPGNEGVDDKEKRDTIF